MNNSIIAVWGSPSSGKTVTSMKLARELEAVKKNVIVIFADLFCPVLSTVMPSVDVKSRTLGSLLHRRGWLLRRSADCCENQKQ